LQGRVFFSVSKVSHPNLVNLLALGTQQRPFRIVSEFCAGGCLFELLHNSDHIDLCWPQQTKMALAGGCNWAAPTPPPPPGAFFLFLFLFFVFLFLFCCCCFCLLFVVFYIFLFAVIIYGFCFVVFVFF